MAQQTIAIDVDDVLSASAAGFADYSNRQWGMNMTADDYDENRAKAWGVSAEEAVERAQLIHDSGAFGEFISIEHALPVLQCLKQRFRLIVVTSRRDVLVTLTNKWLEDNYPGIFEGVHYAGMWDNHDAAKALTITKTEVCKQVGADYLIDDQPKHCISAAEAGIPSLLFGDYTWNKLDAAVDNVHPVKNWQEVEAYFDTVR